MKKPRIALIGIDGLGWNLLLGYSDIFRSTLEIMRNGIKGICISIPPYTPPSWISISTGVNPIRHGIFSSFKIDIEGVKPISSYDIEFPRISEILALNNYVCLVINHIFSYPPEGWMLKNHIIIHDDFSPKDFIYPSFLKPMMKYFRRSYKRFMKGDKKIIEYLKKYLTTKVIGIHELIDSVSPDFMWVMFKEVDTLSHYMPFLADGIYSSKVADLIEILDNFIRDISHTFNYIAIVSDHGFNMYTNRINIWGILRRYGFIRESNLKGSVISLLLSLKVSSLILRAFYLKPSSIKAMYSLRGLFNKIHASKEKKPKSRTNKLPLIIMDPIDSDDAFMIHVADFKYAKILYMILKCYKKEFFKDVILFKKGNIYHIILIPKDNYHFMNDKKLSKREIIYFPSARHDPRGVFILKGYRHIDMVNNRSFIINLRNTDVMPTLLSCANIPIPFHINGKSLLCKNKVKTENYISRWRLIVKLQRLRRGMNS